MKTIHYKIFVISLFTIILTCGILAQSTTIKLPTTDTTSSFIIQKSDNAGIFKVYGDGFLIGGGAYGAGSATNLGNGTRLMWHPRKAALRAGFVSGTQWNEGYIGDYSVAMGFNTTASGSSSVAFGNGSTASHPYSFAEGLGSTASNTYAIAMGAMAQASGNSSVSIGSETVASGGGSVALGYQSDATGLYSVALGRNNTSGGFGSVALGMGATATGDYSIAVGANVEASGNQSIALGSSVMTSGKTGVFIIGDSSNFMTQPYRNNQFVARFKGGYRLYTDNSSNCVYLDSGATSWAHISDSTKKGSFVQADGEYFLNSMSKLRLGSWNYKNQDPKFFRHYGPMAQEIFHYFGKDKYGTVGNDTTLSTADMDGIMMICLQALEKRTNELKTALDELESEKGKTAQLQTSFDELKKEVIRMKRDIQSLTEVKVKYENDNITLNK